MKFRKQQILSRVAILLLVLFAVAITPRQFLHDLCKNHKHASVKHTHDDQTQLNESDYYCGYNIPVTTSPALFEPFYEFDFKCEFVSINSASPEQNLLKQTLVYTLLRGPPVNDFKAS